MPRAIQKPLSTRGTSGMLADPEVRKARARNAILTRWQNHRLKKYLETVAAGEIYLPAYVQSSENKLLAKWQKIIQIVTEEALNKQPWAIKLAFQIRQEYFKDLERKNLARPQREEKPSIHIENALVSMPIVAKTESEADLKPILEALPASSPSTDVNTTNE